MRPPAILLLPVSALLAAGCSNPLASHPGDYGEQVDAERLRRIRSLNIERFARGAEPAPADISDVPAAVEAARERFRAMPEMPLDIHEARASALEHNLDLKVVLVNPTIAAEGVREEEARFEAAFTTQALWRESDEATASSLVDAQQKFQFVEPGVRIPLRTGGTATVSLPVSRNETNNAFSTLNPSYSTDLAFSVSHPLLRNAGREVNTTGIRIASYNFQISEAQTKLAVINQVSAVERAYWLLYQARRNLDVAQQQYDLAQAQLERAERQVRSGRVAEIEIIRAQSGIANRLNDIITAQNSVLQRQRELKRIVNTPGLELDGDTAIVTSTDPNPVEYLVDLPSLSEQAIANRMELLEIELRLLADAASIRFNENQTLPQLDLQAGYTINGLGGSMQDSFLVLEKNKFESWSVGANLEVPLGNEGPKARLRQSVLTRLQRLGTREARRLVVRQEVADAVDRIRAGWQRILATRQATILAARTLQAEQRQFDVGASTSTDVLDAATRLAIAQFEEIQALVEYQLAQIDLAAATGTLLGAAQIEWSPSQPDRAADPLATPIRELPPE